MLDAENVLALGALSFITNIRFPMEARIISVISMFSVTGATKNGIALKVFLSMALSLLMTSG
jgi:hypothetical protein